MQIILSLAVGLFLFSRLVEARQEKYKFRLYAIRDKLIFLVSVNQLAEDSFLFRLLYRAVNTSISQINDLDRWTFIKAVTAARSEFQEVGVQIIKSEINAAPPQVKAVVYEFLDTMICILKANSPFTKLCLLCFRLFKNRQVVASESLGRLKNLVPKEQYESYQYFESLGGDGHQHA